MPMNYNSDETDKFLSDTNPMTDSGRNGKSEDTC